MKTKRTLFVLTLTFLALCLPKLTFAQTRISYGPDPMQYGELSLPEGDGPFPVVTFLHAGCWRSSENMINSYRAMAKAMTEQGVAAWNMQYRGATSPGGGWPGTWLDIANGFDALQSVAESYPIDLQQAVVVGHSSGGHYGAWLAMRSQLPPNSEIYVEPKVNPMALIMADAYINPELIDSIGDTGEIYCGEPLLEKLVGGPVKDNIDNFLQISPLEWLPWGIPQDFIVSTYRYPLSLPRVLALGKTSMRKVPDYPALAVLAGDEINVRMISNEGHGNFVREGERGYYATISAVLRLLGKATE
ncbi:MAG: alpha/beta hydrolase [Gammaproteobacteria bacterium]|jgi:acetyl esterase/lipase|nr:alpha/beta hydrolase [Gammaproteobacteria bacterium]MBT3858228.1 alpha/beta hydrolase [Gammaproteobacteria bacterium]MBT3988668.1 alpha/beta hydrolase [Gammaproteobacteria bacterium]MBT4255542.1 alpha/beta hydrolase [Gammaproteobacteria bacterium]MBT4580624.1 alpha/beta hydrolase [Gammaproteobacteria bacterium]